LAPCAGTLVGWGIAANIFAGAKRVGDAKVVADGPDTASVGKTLAAEGSDSSLRAGSALEIASGFPATVKFGAGGKSAVAVLQKTCAFSLADRLAAGVCASGTAVNLRLAQAVPRLLLANSSARAGFATECVSWVACANAVENFPWTGLLPAVAA
jgi:hypothetical protein